MNVDAELERHVRQVLTTVATATPVPTPPRLRREQGPPRRRWGRVVAPVAVAAATAAVVLVVGTGDDDRTAVRTGTPPSTSTTTTSPPATAGPPATATDTDTVALGDTPFRVPSHLDGFGPAQVWDSPTYDWANGGATYSAAGPVGGPISGTLSLNVTTQPELHDALVARDAGAVVQLVYQENLDARFVEAGPWRVLEVDRTEVIPGAEVGQPDRVYRDWLLPAGDDQVVQVTSDHLDGAGMLAFIARLEGPAPS